MRPQASPENQQSCWDSRLGWAGQGRAGGKGTAIFMCRLSCGHNAKGKPHPSSFDQLPSEFFGGVVERELLTAQVVDWRVALQVEEKVVVEKHLLWLLLTRKQILEMVLVFRWHANKLACLSSRSHAFTSQHSRVSQLEIEKLND